MKTKNEMGKSRVGKLIDVFYDICHDCYVTWDVEVCKESSCYSDVLQLWHEFAVEAAHCVACEEARISLLEVVVDLAQDGQQV